MRDYFVTVDEGGAKRILPGRFARGPEGMFAAPRPAPLLGEHNEEVFGMLEPPSRPSAVLPPEEGETRISPPPVGEGDPERVEGAAAPLPLHDLKVLDLAWVVAGPAIGRALADFGATVVRVESSVRIETARLMGPYLGGVADPQRCALAMTPTTPASSASPSTSQAFIRMGGKSCAISPFGRTSWWKASGPDS